MKQLLKLTRVLLVAIPAAFIVSAVVANCGNGNNGPCSGDVHVTTAADCDSYAVKNSCDSDTFDNGVCNVVNCDNCEVVVDDADPVIDVDDAGF